MGYSRIVRGLARQPGFSALVVATLALGIGVNTALFTVVDAVLLEPPPFPEADRLVALWESDPRRPVRAPSPADFLDIRSQVTAFDGVSAYLGRSAALSGGDEPEQVTFADVSADFFHTLGVPAEVGRVFGPEPVDPGVRSVVLGHGIWTRRFGADPGVVGRTLALDRTSYEIVGVMPPHFRFPADAELWTAAAHDVPGSVLLPGDPRGVRDAWFHPVVARLAPGASLATASAELASLAGRLASEHPDTNEGARIWLRPLHEERVGDVRGTLLLLLGSTGLVLLVVCVNVANLLLVRATGRSRALAVRRALGAPAGHVVASVLGESLVLAAAGSALGLVVAVGALGTLGPWVLPHLPSGISLSLDAGVLLYSVAVAGVVSLAFGALPAWKAASQPPGLSVDRGAGHRSASRREVWVREGLVASEMALAVVLVLAGGLLLRSLWVLQRVDPGFAADHLLTARVGLPGAAERSWGERDAFFRTTADRVTALPGVEAVAWAQRSPVEVGPGAGLRIRGVNEDDPDLVSTAWLAVSSGYFRDLGIPVLEGRTFTDADRADSEPVAVVNRAFARRFFPNESPLGRLVNTGLDGREGDGWRWVRVVGVVGDTRNRGPGNVTDPVLFRPMAQPAPGFRGDRAVLLVQAPGAGTALSSDVRRAVWSVEPEAPVDRISSGRALMADHLAGHRLVSALVASFALLALGLGALGVYGITRQAVVRRTREIGVRMALGAGGGRVVMMVVRQGLRPALVGVAAGLALSLAAARVLRGYLFSVSPLDPLTYAAVPLLLLAVSAVATWLPARGAAGVDPVQAIRNE